MEAVLADTVVDKFQVAPARLEAILVTHPHVAECAVCGLQDEGGQTEVPIAYVTLSPARCEAKGGVSAPIAHDRLTGKLI
jgi:acyl-coenzyme A synthetase/AMP-(fatty) acid ligase